MENEDYYEHAIEASFNAVVLHEVLEWIIRAFISISLLVCLAFVLKYYLIEPYSVNVLELNVEFDNIPAQRNYELRWKMIKDGEKFI